jgi:antitoxin component of RelBE/YafQ-DinJ toxin-antitoxin module
MSKVNTTIRLDSQLKSEATLIATELWTNLSTIVTLFLKNNFIVQRWMSFKLRDSDWFTKESRKDLERLLDETDKWIGLSKPYFNVNTLFDDLDNNAVKY